MWNNTGFYEQFPLRTKGVKGNNSPNNSRCPVVHFEHSSFSVWMPVNVFACAYAWHRNLIWLCVWMVCATIKLRRHSFSVCTVHIYIFLIFQHTFSVILKSTGGPLFVVRTANYICVDMKTNELWMCTNIWPDLVVVPLHIVTIVNRLRPSSVSFRHGCRPTPPFP